MSDYLRGAEPRIHPDIITIDASHEIEVAATRATLSVTIRGMSLFTGNSALTKAREVAQLVRELRSLGLTDDVIRLKGVTADAASGVLGRGSSVSYDLAIDISDLESVADIVGAVAAQKNTVLRGIHWIYDDGEAARSECMAKCIEKANERASILATKLGVRLIGVYNCVEGRVRLVFPLVRSQEYYVEENDESSSRSRQAGRADFDISFSNSRMVVVGMTVEYRISALESR